MSKDIEMWLTNEQIGITITKFSMELKKYCTIQKYKNIESKVKKLGGKAKRGWSGIKSISNDADSVDEKQSGLDAK